MGLKRSGVSETRSAAKILASAEALFAKHGVDQTSIREITELARVNIASVNYHFGSKDDLVEAVYQRLIERVAQERLAVLSRILADAETSSTRPSLNAIVSSFVHPYLGDGNEAQGLLMARFMLALRLTPNPASRRITNTYLNPLAERYVGAFGRACPAQSPERLWWGYMFMVSTTVLTTTESPQSNRLSLLTGGKLSFANRNAVRNELVDFVVGGISNSTQHGFAKPV